MGHLGEETFRKIPRAHRCEHLQTSTYPTRIPCNHHFIQALPYPKYYNTELLTLALLRKKQEVGEVEQAEVDLYKAVDPCIATHFNRTFSSTWNLPSTGLALGGGLLAYSTYFNFSIPTRFVLTIVPVAIDWIWHTRDPINEQRSLDFLNWVVGYRKALCQAERRKTQF